jgi:hypothetical protein
LLQQSLLSCSDSVGRSAKVHAAVEEDDCAVRTKWRPPVDRSQRLTARKLEEGVTAQEVVAAI